MDILKHLENPSPEYRGHPFWSWNDKLCEDELRRQIREMKRVGLGGYFMHARGGLTTEYMSDEWFDCIKVGIDEGKKTGLNAWSYDENGWPSGFADGKVTALGDYYHVRELTCDKYTGKKIPGKLLGLWGVGEKKVRFLGTKIREAKAALKSGETLYYICHIKNPCYVDILNPKVIKAFIDCTHEVYKEKLGDDFGKAMPGFFTDEPQYSGRNIPWSYILPEEFKKTHGYDLGDKLILLYLEKDGYVKFRYDFWMVVNRLYTESFGKQIYDWCEANGCKLTGHAMAEENLISQMRWSGGVMPLYQYEHIPGIDKLMRAIGVPTAAKQVGSAAKQLGKKMVMTETFAGCGWDVSFEELKWIAEWQYVCGVNFMCQHLESYSIRGLRKRDWPPSMFYQSAWWDEYKKFNDYFARLGKLIAESDEEADVLLLHPMHSAYVAYHGSLGKDTHNHGDRIAKLNSDFSYAIMTLAGNHIGYHLGDEIIMKNHGSVDGAELIVGECRYNTVILPSMIGLDSSTYALISKFMANGGKVYALGEKPTLVDGVYSEDLVSLMNTVVSIPRDDDLSTLTLAKLGLKKLSVTSFNGEVKEIHHRTCILEDGTKAYFFQNQNKVLGYNTKITLDCDYDAIRLELEDMSVSKLNTRKVDGKTVIDLHFEPMQSYVILAGNNLPTVTKTVKPSFPIPLTNEWNITRCDDNAMTLDTCRYSLGGAEFSEPKYVREVFKELLDVRANDKLRLVYSFEVSSDAEFEKMNSFRLVSEFTDDFAIYLNGIKLTCDPDAHWLDMAMKVFDIKGKVKHGINEITVDGAFKQKQKVYDVLYGENVLETERNKLTYDTELECMYLVGDFGVFSKTAFVDSVRRATVTDGPFYIGNRPTKLEGANIVPQGYAFFRGNMTLSQNIEIKKSYGERISVELPTPYCSMANVYVNGKFVKSLLWADYKADITDYVKPGETAEISVEAIIGNRNLLGPHHFAQAETYETNPNTFEATFATAPGHYLKRYAFVKSGLGE